MPSLAFLNSFFVTGRLPWISANSLRVSATASLVTAVWTPPPAIRAEGPVDQSMEDMYP